MLTHCGNNVRNRYSGCVFSVKDIVPVPLKTSRNLGKGYTVSSLEFAPKLTSTSAPWLRSRENPARLRTAVRVRTGFRSGLAIHASELCETSRLGVSSLVPAFLRRRLHCPIPAETGKVLEFVNTVMYAEAILDAGRGGRVVPGRWPWATRPTLPSAKIAPGPKGMGRH